MRRILVATDGSDTAARAVDRAVALAAATGASLTLLSVGAGASAVLEREQARLGGDVEVVAATGDAASAICETAEAGDFDLVVLGNKGMTGPSRLLNLGSVPNKVSHHLRRNLLIVKTT